LKVLAAILVAILDFGVTMDTYHIFNSINEFLDLKNILLDTKIISLCTILREIWLPEVFSGHLGSHGGHLGFSAKRTPWDNMPRC
jgi:hypothetical protein